MVDNWLWVMFTDLTAGGELLHGCRFPRGVDTQLVEACALRYPAAYELARRVLILGLLDGVVDAQCIDPCRTRLHLYLRIVYAWLKIDE